jgi:hypothetical protein
MKEEIKKVHHSKIADRCFTCGLGIQHYWYVSSKGVISLVYPTLITFGEYEIFCVQGNLFDEIERYPTLKKAERRIEKLMKGKIVPGNVDDELLCQLRRLSI